MHEGHNRNEPGALAARKWQRDLSVEPLLPIERARVFFDGTFTEPVRLAHPEGVAVDADGNVWCGTENGDLIRIDADGSSMRAVASTGGFIAGIAFDHRGNLFACDIRYGRMYRLDAEQRRLEPFGEARLRIPNYPVVDVRRNCMYVSDSFSFDARGPGVWRFDLDTGGANLWYGRDMAFANGMALRPQGDALLVVESTRCAVVEIPIRASGEAGEPRTFVDGVTEFPDGLALARDGTVYISCYEPSVIYRTDPNGDNLRPLIRDRVATLIAHPTNMAFRGEEMFTTNLGRWHITRIDVGAEGLPLPVCAP